MLFVYIHFFSFVPGASFILAVILPDFV